MKDMPKKIAPAVWLVLQELKKRLLLLQAEAPRKKLLLAVSGGADSLALADAAALLQQELGYELLVCHVEHGLRGEEALADADKVKNFCLGQQLPFYCCHVAVKEYCRQQGCSLEEGARILRYRALAAQALQSGADLVLTAHHRDDQVETFFLRLLRGAGLEGLKGMSFLSCRDGVKLARPLLQLSRAELEEYCRQRGIVYCQDSSNQDTYYTRNSIRLELLPLLEQKYNSRLREAVSGTMEQLREAESFIEEEEDHYWQQLQDINGGERDVVISWPLGKLKRIPPIIRKRLYRRAYFSLGGKELSYERTLALEELVQRGTGGKEIQLPQEISVICSKGRLLFKRNKGEI